MKLLTHFPGANQFNLNGGTWGIFWRRYFTRNFVTVLFLHRTIMNYTHEHALCTLIIPPTQQSCWGVYWFHSFIYDDAVNFTVDVCPSVRPSRIPCLLCSAYSSQNAGVLVVLVLPDTHVSIFLQKPIEMFIAWYEWETYFIKDIFTGCISWGINPCSTPVWIRQDSNNVTNILAGIFFSSYRHYFNVMLRIS